MREIISSAKELWTRSAKIVRAYEKGEKKGKKKSNEIGVSPIGKLATSRVIDKV